MIQETAQSALGQLQGGHGLMALCAVLYLAWWIVFFRPDAGKVQGPLYWIGAGCLVVAAIAGITRRGLHRSGRKRSRSRNRTERLVVRAGRPSPPYILLAWATAHFWNRPHHHRAAAIRGVGRFGALCRLCSGSGRYPWPYRHMVSRCDHLLRVRPVTYLLRSVLPPDRHTVLRSPEHSP